MEENKFGVEAIKRALTQLSQVTSALFLIDTDEDGDIETGETLTFASKLFPILISFSGDIENITNEVTDAITSTEWDALVAHVNKLNFVPDQIGKEDLEAYIKTVINWFDYNRKFVETTIDFFAGYDEDAEELAMLEGFNEDDNDGVE